MIYKIIIKYENDISLIYNYPNLEIASNEFNKIRHNINHMNDRKQDTTILLIENDIVFKKRVYLKNIGD